MKLAVVLAALVGIFVLACSSAAPAEPTLNIDATIEARAKELVAAQATDKPTATEVATPIPTKAPAPVPTKTPAPSPTEQPAMTPAPTPTAVPTGDWTILTSVNPMDDSTTVSAVLTAREGRGTYGDDISIFLRCKSRELDVFIAWGSYLGIDDPQITTRIGDAPAQTTRWALSSNNQISFSTSPQLLIDSLSLAGDRYVAQVTPYSESPITAVFNLIGIEKAAKQVTDNCSNSIQSTTSTSTAVERELPVSGTISPPVSSQAIQSSIDSNWSFDNNGLIWEASYISPNNFFPNGADLLNAEDLNGWGFRIYSTPLPSSVIMDSPFGVADSSVAKVRYLERARIILLALRIDQASVDSLISLIDSDLVLVESRVDSEIIVGPYLVGFSHRPEGDWPEIFGFTVRWDSE
jgi:type VI secretion system protein VasI